MTCLLTVHVCILLAQAHLILANISHDTSTGIPGKKQGNVTLGGLFFLHYKGINNEECGDFNVPGLGHAQAMIYAIEKINNHSNLLPNISLGYEIHDYCESASLAMKATYHFVQGTDSHFACSHESTPLTLKNNDAVEQPSPIVSLIGPADSGSSVLVGSLLKVAGIPAISYAATSEELSSPFYKHFYRTVPSDKQQASAMADLFEFFHWSYVGAVAVDDSYGRYGVWALEKESFTRKSFCIALSEYIPRLNYMSKIEIVVSKLKRHTNVKVIVLWLFGGYGRGFLKEAEKQNLLDRTWILSDALAAEQPETHIQSLFNVLDGALGIQPLYHHSKEFETYLTELTPETIMEKRITYWWDKLWMSEFNCSVLNTKNFLRCDHNVTLSSNVVQKLYDAFLPYVIEAVYAVAHALHNMYFCTEPHGLLPGGRCPDTHPSVHPLDVDLHLRNVSFEGLMGKVQFDESGNPLTSSYGVINFQRRHEKGVTKDFKQIVGSWNKASKERLLIAVDKIKWRGSFSNSSIPNSACSLTCPPGTSQSVTTACCWECTECPLGSVNPYPGSRNCSECPKGQRSNNERTECENLPIVNVKLTDTTGYLTTGFTSLGVLLTIFSCLVLIKYRDTPLVKASSRELSAILLMSIAMFFAQAFLSLRQPTTLVCRLAYCFNYSAQGTCVATLMIKTLRILSAFHANLTEKRAKQCILTTKMQATLVILLNSAVFGLLTVWFLLDAPYMASVTQQGEFIFFTCRPHRSNLGFGLHVAINGYLVLLSLICTFHAFKARKLPENFNEARYIGFAMYILLLSSIAYFPVDFAGLENRSVAIVTCVTTLVSSYGLLGCMFAPKLYVILFHPEQNTTAAVRDQVSNYTFRNSWPSALTSQSN